VNSLLFIPLAFSANPVAARHAGDLDSPDYDRKPLYLKISRCGRFLVASELCIDFSIRRPMRSRFAHLELESDFTDWGCGSNRAETHS
jgi:hypothetical protein